VPVVAAAFCPHPPVILPDVAVGAAAELDTLRSACDAAVRALVGQHPDRIVVVGRSDVGVPQPQPSADAALTAHASGAVGSLAGYGIDLRVVLGGDDGTTYAALPLSLTIGAWLLQRTSQDADVAGIELPADLTPDAARDVGGTLAEIPARVGLLVMGDGSARLSTEAPGHTGGRARDWQDGVSRALTTGDPDFLRALDPAAADEQLASGRPAWQVAAAAAPWVIDVPVQLVEECYGVGYIVAAWVPR